MKVILIDDVTGLGKRGEVVTVKNGYARNYLMPQQKAIPSTPSNIKMFQEEEKHRVNKLEREKVKAEKLRSKIEKLKIEIPVKTGEEGKLFGSVGSIDILNALREKGVEIEKGMIQMEESLRKLGEYDITIKLHPEVELSLKVRLVEKD